MHCDISKFDYDYLSKADGMLREVASVCRGPLWNKFNRKSIHDNKSYRKSPVRDNTGIKRTQAQNYTTPQTSGYQLHWLYIDFPTLNVINTRSEEKAKESKYIYEYSHQNVRLLL